MLVQVQVQHAAVYVGEGDFEAMQDQPVTAASFDNQQQSNPQTGSSWSNQLGAMPLQVQHAEEYLGA